jgi:hypothetical protein
MKEIAMAKMQQEFEMMKAAVDLQAERLADLPADASPASLTDLPFLSIQDIGTLPLLSIQDGAGSSTDVRPDPILGKAAQTQAQVVQMASKDASTASSLLKPGLARDVSAASSAGVQKPMPFGSASAASSTVVRSDSLSAIFAQKDAQAVPIPSSQASGSPPMDDFTKGLLEKLGGIVRESVTEHVNVAMTHATEEFQPWLQQSDDKRASLSGDIEALKQSLAGIKAP